ncbi:ETEC_3214 domain-containing protein [Thalassotalea sp. ND16A]|uniref:ETEC_3214 domain-containing protein n=1 Tax=Thalassotalea sp. ND16A TaxID=1535422 RepID=UPI00051D4139|nr:ETEC_3214 domain-containing protein [Thalassotalea sp. ND16A]KGJ99065.1 hypothetical protein ND16A_0396 [Thalassotalea sp. ND16A]
MNTTENTPTDETITHIIEEVIEHQTEVAKPSYVKRVQTSIMMFAAIMISAGQWADTRELAIDLYEDGVAIFTDQLEYEVINRINVGNSVQYVQSFYGEPQIIKRSKLNQSILFQYYTKDKYDLTLITSDSRIVGYSIYPKVDGFAPNIPFLEKLGDSSLRKMSDQPGNYHYDINNLFYYLESQELGKQQMFLTVIRGYLEYAAQPQPSKIAVNYKTSLLSSFEALNKQEMFATNDEEVLPILDELRKKVIPNFYAITELKTDIVAESLLTRYEYLMFTES